MDDLEPELRAAFGRLADGAEPSDALVGKTLARSTAIRRRRNAITASGVAAAVLVVTFAVAAVAGPDHRGSNFQIAGPGLGGVPVASTTVTPATPTTPPTTAHAGPVVTSPRPATTTVPTSTTTLPVCPQPTAASPTLELQSGGEIAATVAAGPGSVSTVYKLDDGSYSAGGLRKVYTPAEFGPHWYEITVNDVNGHPCPQRINFNVDLLLLTTTTTGTTDSSVPPDSTTIPETTTSVG